MADFPTMLKPSVNEGYSYTAPNNVIAQQVQGGVPLQMLDYSTGPVPFTVNIVANPLRLQVFQDFYFGQINSGADKFNMTLDSGNGLETHIVQIQTDSLTIDQSRDPIILISFTVVAEKTPAQDAPFGGDLAELYDIYGDGLPDLLDALAKFTLEVLPA